MRWFKRADIGIRPRDVLHGLDVNIYPFTRQGVEWIEQNINRLSDPVWSQKERCLKLSRADSSHFGLTLITSMLDDAGLKMRFYGRLKGWDKNKPWI
jgi:hypothetical protein